MISVLSVNPFHQLASGFGKKAGISFCPDGTAGAAAQERRARVLGVEDDYFVAMEIESTLIEMGCDVVGILATAEDAIDCATRERPDLVLMDIRLAGSLDGIEAATEIYHRIGIRSLFVTAHSDPDTRRRGEAANPLGWAAKPFTSRQLSMSVNAALDSLGSKN
jgi:DNA-binding NarL/FixJ family response regulator